MEKNKYFSSKISVPKLLVPLQILMSKNLFFIISPFVWYVFKSTSSMNDTIRKTWKYSSLMMCNDNSLIVIRILISTIWTTIKKFQDLLTSFLNYQELEMVTIYLEKGMCLLVPDTLRRMVWSAIQTARIKVGELQKADASLALGTESLQNYDQTSHI